MLGQNQHQNSILKHWSPTKPQIPHRNLKAAALGALGLSCALMSAAPSLAGATELETIEGRSGTTEVTVVATDGNLKFRVPTVIPFVADYDGKLQGPSAATTYIENLSAFSIKVTNVKVNPSNGWTHTADIEARDNSVEWQIGPASNTVIASKANCADGVSIDNEAWNMSYGGDSVNSDKIYLTTDGQVQRVTKDISSAVQIGTVTFTVAPGVHGEGFKAADTADITEAEGL